jgi:hypothetical protein
MMGAMVVNASMLSFQLMKKHIPNPPARESKFRKSAESIQFTGSAIEDTSLVSREVSCSYIVHNQDNTIRVFINTSFYSHCQRTQTLRASKSSLSLPPLKETHIKQTETLPKVERNNPSFKSFATSLLDNFFIPCEPQKKKFKPETEYC